MNKFDCPHCGKPHLMLLDHCPETGEAISEVHKLEGVVLAERYKLESRISEGGMGVVYEALHIKLDRRVAVKLLHPYLRVSSETMKRFENEARLAASIGHKNIVDVIDMGRHQGLPYFVMEYLDGEGLNEILKRRGTLPRAEAVDLCVEILDALTAVHAKGIIHRDLKPGNVMLVTQPGGSRIVKVLDFGICRLQDQTQSSLNLTRTGSIFGTPRYMSPEQAKGEKDIDHRADLYSVGVILYRTITGAFPFTGDNYNALLNSIANDDPIPAGQHLSAIPEGLEAIIMRSIARSLDSRYQSAEGFIEALAPYASVPPPIPADQFTDPDFRPTIKARAARPETQEEPEEEKSGTVTGWDRTAGKRWTADFTWVLPVAIVVVLAAAGITALVMFLIPRLNRQEQELERMTRVLGARDRLDEVLPEKKGGTQPAPEPAVLEGSDIENSVRFDVTGLPGGAKVLLDGKPLPQLPILIEADHQPHAMRIEAPGFLPYEADVLVLRDTELEVTMEPAPSGTHKKKGEGDISEPPIDMKYPGVVGKKKGKKKTGK
ncbi:MAG: serine/threonine protein kinase [Deltaproteobacteria bacterium]|nr:serine/threonine protein kinase [Deltaproteobacteria bacterium]